MKQVTIAICVDALRYDFVNPHDSPFLYNLSTQGSSFIIEGSLNYETIPMWFAGLYPENSDRWLLYWHSPSTSPYRRLPTFGLNLIRYRKLRFAAQLVADRIFKSEYGTAPYVPLNMMKYFDFCEKHPPWHSNYLAKPTLFSIMKTHGLQWLYIGMPGSDQKT